MFRLLVISRVLAEVVSTSAGKKFYTSFVSNSSLYDRNFAPFDDGHKVNVHIFCYQVVLTSVVENSQSVEYIAEINYTWHDPRLKFDRREYGTWNLYLPPNSVWIPRIDMYNAKNNRDIKSDILENAVEVKYNGNVSLISYAHIESACHVDVSEFPFDEQWCVIGFTSALASIEHMELTTHPDLVFFGLPEWDIVDTSAKKMSYDQSGRNYSLAEVIVHLKRKPDFYIHLLIVPTFIITSICISAMLLPLDVDLGERINLGIAGLLSLTFMLSIMLGELPKSPSLPLMGKWVIAELVFCCIGMLIPMLMNIAERRSKIELRRYFKYITLVFFILVNMANCLTTILLFVFRTKAEAPEAYKSV